MLSTYVFIRLFMILETQKKLIINFAKRDNWSDNIQYPFYNKISGVVIFGITVVISVKKQS